MRDLSIGEAERQSGVKATTIRFYEERGLLPAPPRSGGNRRLYGPEAVARLAFIRHARDLGFGLEDVAELLVLQGRPGARCEEADGLARRHLLAVEARIRALEALRGALSRMVQGCAGGAVADCRVIETLADHARCAADHPVVQ